MSIKMNTKRNKKSNLDNGLPTNSTKKKSKNLVNIEVENNIGSTTIKNQKKKESINMIPNENNKEIVKVGRKRKQPDTDVESSTPKKSRKKKVETNLNVDEENVVPMASTTNNNMEQLNATKRNKKKPKPPPDPSYLIADMNNTHVGILEISEQKVSKKKETLPITSVTSTNKINLHEVVVVKNEPLGNNDNIVEITLKELEEPESDLNENDIFSEFDKKKEKKQENPEPRKKVKKEIKWPEDDVKTLINRMEMCVPDNDLLAFNTRAERLEWDTIAFKNYTAEDCKNTWLLLQKQIRRFRLLKEVLHDAKEWIARPKGEKSKSKKKKNFRHPDMPRKPLTAYFIYYLRKRDEYLSAHPGLDATEISKILGQEFKNLPPEKRSKYETLAAKKKKEYEEKLEEFYQTHPDVPRIVKTPRIRTKKPPRPPKPPKPPKVVKEKAPPKERIPKRPPPPFQYYYLSELQTIRDAEDKITFKEECKERWKQLPDKKKVVWINYAEAEYAKYEQELKNYVQTHPAYVHNSQKPILTKEEIQIKDRVAGKPIKPPNSAYNLFARMLLQSEEIKNIPVRDRLNFVSNQWKNCAEEEKKQYRDLSAKLNEKYKLDFASYLETLPEAERKMELQKTLPKRRKSDTERAKKPKAKKKKKSVRRSVTKKIVEPEQPPISAFKYFATLYTGEEPVAQAWKALTPEQKKIYEDELIKKKQAYIVDFEKFLKSLTKEELEAFSNSRRKMKTEPEDDEEEESSESGSEDSEPDSNDEIEGNSDTE